MRKRIDEQALRIALVCICLLCFAVLMLGLVPHAHDEQEAENCAICAVLHRTLSATTAKTEIVHLGGLFALAGLCAVFCVCSAQSLVVLKARMNN
ncbi:MAG: hypothetical protein FWG87_05130 [Defluviitaleaceae bacterium]|nr:hypothetical protein [Defluviitaleaceae bacterium]